MAKTILPPVHTDFETGFVVADYPYGFRLRTELRIWIETKKGTKEQRVVSRTLNPETGEWNKPKAGTYRMMAVLFIEDETGHVENNTMSQYNTENAGEFLAEYGEGLSEWHRGKLIIFDAYNRAQDELGIRVYGASTEQIAAIRAKRNEILETEGHGDLISKIL